MCASIAPNNVVANKVMPLNRKLRLALLGAGGAIYLVLGYLASSSNHPPLLVVLITALPVVIGLLAACWQTPLRFPALLLGLFAAVVVTQRLDFLLSHAAWFYFLQHVGAMVALAIMFGSTLRTHEGALCSRVAKFAIAAPLDARYFEYTWKVTLAWTIYFVASAIISSGLFFASSLAVWSLFATILTPISLPLMFGGEYLIRQRALPGRAHFSIAQTIESYQKYVQRRDCPE